ncbi:MAG: glycosyltransferase [Myxacorys californica WJT36-NPBG1]|jgi:phosphoheptose isomerase|nr:glycosyltransferase [Myxacorys californica WJT36-NPBG1]
MKRIALISEHASPFGVLGGVDSGGQNVYVGQIAKHLAQRGYEVDIFTRCDRALLPEVAQWIEGVRLIHVPAGPATEVRKEDLLPYMATFTKYVLKFCQSVHYDLIHANFWMSGLVAAEIKRKLNIPFVITFHALGRVRRFHQGTADDFPDERFEIEDQLVQAADRIIAECPQDEADLIQLYNADPHKITIIPCGFDPTEFWCLDKALARAALGILPDERIVLQLGRMVPRKGVDTAIGGFAQFCQTSSTPARLIVVGGEEHDADPRIAKEVNRLAAIADHRGIRDRVQFVGRKGREVLRYYYSAADVFITTPWYEPFGITPLEAMACGTPVIGSNVGGIKFSVVDGETGYLVPPNQPDAIAHRLTHLYDHPNLLATLSRQAVTRAKEHFTWQRVTDAIATLYRSVLISSAPTQDALTVIDQGFTKAIDSLHTAQHSLQSEIIEAATLVKDCFAQGGKVLICGNGGSAADAQHCAAEFVGRFKLENRPGLPAIALTADSAILTAWSNDVGFDQVFARQVEALAQPPDVLIGISTSGRSKNLIRAFEVARDRNIRCLGILGGDGGTARSRCDLSIVVPATDAQHVQEVQMVVIHLLCELVEAWIMAGQTESLTQERQETKGQRSTGNRRTRKLKLPLTVNY